MLQTMVFYVTDVFLLCCGCYFLMLQKIYMLHTTFTHVTAEIFTARLTSDARRPDASSPFTKSNRQYMAMSWPHTPPSWPCPGHILLHPGHVLATYFSILIDILHRSSHSSMVSSPIHFEAQHYGSVWFVGLSFLM